MIILQLPIFTQMKTENDKPKAEKPKLTVKEVKELQDKAVNKVGKVVCK